jgi:hypothetical protein
VRTHRLSDAFQSTAAWSNGAQSLSLLHTTDGNSAAVNLGTTQLVNLTPSALSTGGGGGRPSMARAQHAKLALMELKLYLCPKQTDNGNECCSKFMRLKASQDGAWSEAAYPPSSASTTLPPASGSSRCVR